MERFLKCFFNPSVEDPAPIPDEFPKRVSTFSVNGDFTLPSSAAKGHAYCIFYPQLLQTSGTWALYYGDNVAQLDVSNLPTIANMSSTTVTGQNLLTYYSFCRLTALEVAFTYVGAVQTGAGEARVGLMSVQTNIAGTNVKGWIQDTDFYCIDRAECTYICRWLPMDDSDLKFRMSSDSSEADKNQYTNSIVFTATGLPLNINCYNVRYNAVFEGVVIPSTADFIPRSMSPVGSLSDVLKAIKAAVCADPRRVATTVKTTMNWSHMLPDTLASSTPVDSSQFTLTPYQQETISHARGYSSVPFGSLPVSKPFSSYTRDAWTKAIPIAGALGMGAAPLIFGSLGPSQLAEQAAVTEAARRIRPLMPGL